MSDQVEEETVAGNAADQRRQGVRQSVQITAGQPPGRILGPSGDQARRQGLNLPQNRGRPPRRMGRQQSRRGVKGRTLAKQDHHVRLQGGTIAVPDNERTAPQLLHNGRQDGNQLVVIPPLRGQRDAHAPYAVATAVPGDTWSLHCGRMKLSRGVCHRHERALSRPVPRLPRASRPSRSADGTVSVRRP